MCAPGSGGAGGKAQGRGPRAGPVGCRELPGRLSWRRAEGLSPTPPQSDPCLLPEPLGTTHPAEGQGSVHPGCRRLHAEPSRLPCSVSTWSPPTLWQSAPWQEMRPGRVPVSGWLAVLAPLSARPVFQAISKERPEGSPARPREGSRAHKGTGPWAIGDKR